LSNDYELLHYYMAITGNGQGPIAGIGRYLKAKPDKSEPDGLRSPRVFARF